MLIILHVVILIVGFVLLIKGADFFVDGAAGIAAKSGVSQLIIGLTIVAMGTSAPEAAVSIISSINHSAGLAIGNVLGSNTMNVYLILGVTAVIMPLLMARETVRFDIPFVIIATIVLGLLGLTDNSLSRIDGVILFAMFLIYLGYLFRQNKKNEVEKEPDVLIRSNTVLIGLLVAGIAMILIGSECVVKSASWIAATCGMSERTIGLTIVAIGTSLPELVTCIVAATKNKADIAVGNIIGSNIFNILFVLGIAAMVYPLEYGMEFLADTIICLSAPVLLLLFTLNKKKTLTRIGGAVFLACYGCYFIWVFIS